MKKLLLLFLFMFVVSCAITQSFGPNTLYEYPINPNTGGSCEGVGEINRLTEGTDNATQFGIYIAGMGLPQAIDDLRAGFQILSEVMEVGMQAKSPPSITTTTQLRAYLHYLVSDINNKYGTMIIKMTPVFNNVLNSPIFKNPVPLEYCSYHRLKYWADANDENLALLQ